MATEYKLSYTASEIDEKLGKIDENTNNIGKLQGQIADLEENGTGAVTDEQVQNAVNKYLDENGIEFITEEPIEDDIPHIYFTGVLPTSKNDGDLPVTIRYISKTKDFKYYATLKVQGGSSVNYAKKNFTLKMYEDEALENKVKYVFKDWGELNKWVLKAHWIDHSHVRNVGTAKIWSKIVESRSDYNSLPEELRTAPNNGATDGFTVKVFANGIYQGLYEWIVPKDKLFGQDGDNPNHSIMNSEWNNQPTCAFATTTPTINGNWSEELQDAMYSSISTSFANFIKFVAGSTDKEFVENAENYFDVQSVIDYDIFARVFCIVDNLCRNQIFFTYDGVKWYEGAWDLDAILGLPPTTRGFFTYNTPFQTGYIAYKDHSVINMLYQRVENLFTERFKARYNELRANVLSIENILEVYERLTNVIKTYDGLLQEDFASTTGDGKFTGIPYTSENNIQQIRSFVAKRIPYMDEVVANIGSGDEPDIPVEPDNPEVTLSSISATYTGGEVAEGTALTELTGITVTAHYSDGTTSNVTGYTLSGTIAEGTNTITVSYSGKTTTFTVIGVAEPEAIVVNGVPFVHGYYVAVATGEMEEGIASDYASDYVDIIGATRILFGDSTLSYANSRVHFYDSDKKQISYTSLNAKVTYISVPTNTKYVRFSMFTDKIETFRYFTDVNVGDYLLDSTNFVENKLPADTGNGDSTQTGHGYFPSQNVESGKKYILVMAKGLIDGDSTKYRTAITTVGSDGNHNGLVLNSALEFIKLYTPSDDVVAVKLRTQLEAKDSIVWLCIS